MICYTTLMVSVSSVLFAIYQVEVVGMKSLLFAFTLWVYLLLFTQKSIDIFKKMLVENQF